MKRLLQALAALALINPLLLSVDVIGFAALRRAHPEMFDGDAALRAINSCLDEA